MVDFETIKLGVANGIATLTLNRPDRMNAFTDQMVRDMIAAFDETDANDDVRVVIVTGAGRAFCAGADLGSGGATFDYEKRLADRGGSGKFDPDRARDGGGQVGIRIYESTKPVIAAINGAAVGVGATMTLPMDIRLAVPGAKMGFVFARRGIVPETLSSYFLPRLVGVSTALEWTITGRVFTSEEAHERGLVRSLHAPDDLMPAALALAREIADNTAPVSVALARRMILDMLDAGHPMDAHCLESRLMVARGQSGDAKEGVTSFLEKRTPNYPDRVSRDMPQPYPWRPTPPFKA
jgi:enoyl-CoA hydratase/carnithine racemase